MKLSKQIERYEEFKQVFDDKEKELLQGLDFPSYSTSALPRIRHELNQLDFAIYSHINAKTYTYDGRSFEKYVYNDELMNKTIDELVHESYEEIAKWLTLGDLLAKRGHITNEEGKKCVILSSRILNTTE